MRRLGLACALAAAAILRIYAVASAHVTLVSSTPAADSRLSESPEQFRLEFSEPVEAGVAKAELIATGGGRTPLALMGDPRNAYVLLAPANELEPGAYRLVWHVVSEDGHPVSGSFVFTIGATVSAPPPMPADVEEAAKPWGPSVGGAPALPSTLRGLGVGSLAALAGILFFLTTARGAANSTGTGIERVARSLAIAAPVLLALHLVAWLINTAPDHRLTGAWIGAALGSTVGQAELWRTILAVPPLWALVLARRAGLALGLAIVGLLASAAVGHSAAFQPIISIPLKAVHLLALAAWLGGLVWLSMRERVEPAQFIADTKRVSSVALIAVIAIAISGIAQTLLIHPLSGDWTSSYGIAAMIKVAGLAVLVGFGAYHRFRVLPALEKSTSNAGEFVASLRREVAVLWLVVIVGGFLSYISPPAKDGVDHSQHTHSGSEQ
ncbi:MAG TPA: copper resistance protein CopC [Gemmatimonadaceae bacterium]|nr:copper resistance protein CopC [Gemmatimonadaceae bacterium]